MRVRRSEYRNMLHDKVADLAAPAALDWLSALVTDLAVDQEGRAALTPYNAPSGQQSLWTYFEKPLAAVRSEPSRLREALTGWRRIDKFTGEYLDHRVLCSAAEHPLGRSTEAGVPGATWLAIQALPLLRLTGDGRNPQSTLWHRIGQRTMMIWPLWQSPLDEHAVRVLIEHPLLRPNATARNGQRPEPQVSRRKLAPLGVFEVCGAERLTIDGRKSAGVLAPIAIPDP
jgi:CRISPR-associated endonuclease/helicase Cas3